MSDSLPVVLAVYPILLSGITLVWLFNVRRRSRPRWATRVLVSASVITFVFVSGPWAFTSYYLRYVFIGLFLLVAVLSYFRREPGGSHSPASNGGFPVPSVIVLVLFAALTTMAIASHYPSGNSLDVAFPLRSGPYYVLQGGTSIVTNPFHALGSNKLAVDIVKLNSLGNRADGIAPRALLGYRVFGEKVHSPCQGSVLEVRDSLPDNPPGDPDTEHSAGNYMLLNCLSGNVLMAHLRQGSINALPGATVNIGQPLAEVGNSGNSLEPHLHIEATKDGKAIGLRFDGRFLVINSLVTRK